MPEPLSPECQALLADDLPARLRLMYQDFFSPAQSKGAHEVAILVEAAEEIERLRASEKLAWHKFDMVMNAVSEAATFTAKSKSEVLEKFAKAKDQPL